MTMFTRMLTLAILTVSVGTFAFLPPCPDVVTLPVGSAYTLPPIGGL